MAVEVHLPSMFRTYAEGRMFVECHGSTVRDCLDQIVDKYPQLKDQLFDKNGGLKKVIEIYVNGKSAYPMELEKELNDGDKVFVTLMLAGG